VVRRFARRLTAPWRRCSRGARRVTLTCSGVISAQTEVRCECRRVTAGWVRACPRRRLGNTRGRRIPHIGKQSSDRPDFT
jgi:hypothetical protein